MLERRQQSPRSASFAYTPNGDLGTKSEGGTTWTYAYDEAGLLKEVKEGSAVRATYAYDGLSRLVKAVEDGAATFFAYGLGIDPIWERTGTTEARHEYGNGMRIARVVGAAPFTAYYYHADALGSTWRITDADKAVAFASSYEPFGRPWGASGPLASSERYRFLGERNDAESGFTYLRARQYDARTGRFTALDPVLGALGAPQTLNRYPYAANNPATYTDPTGEFLWILFLLVYAHVIAGTVAWGATGDPTMFMVAIGLLPGLDFLADIYFAITDCGRALSDPSAENKGWCAASVGFALIPFVGMGMVRLGRIANRADNLARVGDIRFGQRSASVGVAHTSAQDIFDLADGLRKRTISPSSLGPIKVVDRGGVLFAKGGNRRLLALRMAGLDDMAVPIIYVDEYIPLSRLVDGGRRIKVGGLGIWDPIRGFI